MQSSPRLFLLYSDSSRHFSKASQGFKVTYLYMSVDEESRIISINIRGNIALLFSPGTMRHLALIFFCYLAAALDIHYVTGTG
jgi:hypothetical protein